MYLPRLHPDNFVRQPAVGPAYEAEGERALMSDLNYDTMIEPWKTDLVVRRARRMGFRRDELDDVQQELALEVMAFRYDPHKSNGATERTALRALIDNQLKKLVRRRARYRTHVERSREHVASRGARVADTELAMDVRAAVASLDEEDRVVCRALGLGLTRHEIAQSLRCGWHTVDRIIERVRRRFEEYELDGWVSD